MNKKIYILTLGLMFTGQTLAFNFMYGWYAHIDGGISYLQGITDTKSKHKLEIESRPPVGSGFPPFNAGLKVGYRFDQFRAEISSHYNQIRISDVISTQNGVRADTHKNIIKSPSHIIDFMLNGYYDHYLDSPIRLVLGLGVGYGRSKFEYQSAILAKFTKHHNMFVYNAMAGIKYIINHMWDMNLEYRYLSSFSQVIGRARNSSEKHENSISSHSLNLGIMLKIA